MTSSTPIIAGVVRDGKGDPVAAARVYIVAAPVSVPDIAALSDSDGRFSIGVPMTGHYTIEASAEGWRPGRTVINVGPDVNHVELRLSGS